MEPFQPKEEEENSMHNTVVMFSTSDHFTLRQVHFHLYSPDSHLKSFNSRVGMVPEFHQHQTLFLIMYTEKSHICPNIQRLDDDKLFISVLKTVLFINLNRHLMILCSNCHC